MDANETPTEYSTCEHPALHEGFPCRHPKQAWMEVNLDAFIEEVQELQVADGKGCSWNDARWAVITTVETWTAQFPEAGPLDINNEQHYDAIVYAADALL